VPGSPGQPYYYGVDQIGSVRRVFASASSAPAYSYDPYGNPLQATAPLTDFGYAGMLYNADSGLDLTRYRAYDPVAGRWLSRDPLGEAADPVGNLYTYVGGNPISLMDPLGLCGNPWDSILQAFASNPWLFPAIAATELLGGGPEDPIADAIVAEEIAAAEGLTATAEGATAATDVVGPYSTWDTSGGLKGINTNVTADEFSANLQSNGYTATTTTGSNVQ
jgi:RHS repeat-associated protein